MIIYKRPIEKKLMSLRLLLAISLLTIAGIFQNNFFNLFYFLITLFLFLNLIVVKDFVVSPDSMKVINYYLFGLVPVKWTFSKSHDIIMKSDGSTYGSDLDIPDTDNSSTGLGILFGCLFPIIVKPKVGMINYTFQRMKPNGKMTIKVHVFLTKEEFHLAEAFVRKKHGI